MRILTISDTHIPVVARALPPVIEEEARNSAACLHAGDFIDFSVFEALNRLTKTYGVCGNMDDDSIKKKLPTKQILHFEEVTIGLIHGGGSPSRLIEYIQKEFSTEEKIDMYVFGHSHYPLDKTIDGVIYFNPGSATDTVFAPYRSYGILEIQGHTIQRKVIKIE